MKVKVEKQMELEVEITNEITSQWVTEHSWNSTVALSWRTRGKVEGQPDKVDEVSIRMPKTSALELLKDLAEKLNVEIDAEELTRDG